MSWSTSASTRLKRVFGADLEIVEPRTPFAVTIYPKHAKKGVPGMAACCAIAKACGNANVAILQTATYIQVGRKVHKYQNGEDAGAFIKMFDKQGVTIKLDKPMRVTFLPVAPSHRKAACRKRHETLKARIAAGIKPRAYKKPTAAKGSKVHIYSARLQRTIVADYHGRCATRWQAL